MLTHTLTHPVNTGQPQFILRSFSEGGSSSTPKRRRIFSISSFSEGEFILRSFSEGGSSSTPKRRRIFSIRSFSEGLFIPRSFSVGGSSSVALAKEDSYPSAFRHKSSAFYQIQRTKFTSYSQRYSKKSSVVRPQIKALFLHLQLLPFSGNSTNIKKANSLLAIDIHILNVGRHVGNRSGK